MKTYFVAFLVLYLTSFFITLLFPIPYVDNDWPIYLFIAQAALTLLFFLVSSFCDPGYLPKAHK